MRLLHNPRRIPGESPTSYGSHESLRIRETKDEIRQDLVQMRRHAVHAALGDGPKRQDGRLLLQPVRGVEGGLQVREEDGE